MEIFIFIQIFHFVKALNIFSQVFVSVVKFFNHVHCFLQFRAQSFVVEASEHLTRLWCVSSGLLNLIRHIRIVQLFNLRLFSWFLLFDHVSFVLQWYFLGLNLFLLLICNITQKLNMTIRLGQLFLQSEALFPEV